MDRLKDSTLRALEQVICAAENLTNVKITQDLEKEILIIEDLNLERTAVIHCGLNSVGATLRQVCKYINNKTLFCYEAGYYGGEDTMPVEDNTIRYHYKDGTCSFMIDGIEVEVLDCRDMRKDPSINIERYADICVISISYIDDESKCFNYHIIPEAWMYGSTTDDFEECAEVHPEFINAAREYIKQHNITKEMQEVKDD